MMMMMMGSDCAHCSISDPSQVSDGCVDALATRRRWHRPGLDLKFSRRNSWECHKRLGIPLIGWGKTSKHPGKTDMFYHLLLVPVSISFFSLVPSQYETFSRHSPTLGQLSYYSVQGCEGIGHGPLCLSTRSSGQKISGQQKCLHTAKVGNRLVLSKTICNLIVFEMR